VEGAEKALLWMEGDGRTDDNVRIKRMRITCLCLGLFAPLAISIGFPCGSKVVNTLYRLAAVVLCICGASGCASASLTQGRVFLHMALLDQIATLALVTHAWCFGLGAWLIIVMLVALLQTTIIVRILACEGWCCHLAASIVLLFLGLLAGHFQFDSDRSIVEHGMIIMILLELMVTSGICLAGSARCTNPQELQVIPFTGITAVDSRVPHMRREPRQAYSGQLQLQIQSQIQNQGGAVSGPKLPEPQQQSAQVSKLSLRRTSQKKSHLRTPL